MKDIYYAVAHRPQAEIDSFKNRYDRFDTSQIPQIFKKSLNLDINSWKRSSSWGTSHVIYFVRVKNYKRALVLRANLGVGKPEVVMQVEKLVTDAVAQTGIPTNRVLFADVTRKHFPFDFQIQKKLKGRDLEDHFHGSQAEYDRMSFELGEYVAKIHSLIFPNFGRFDEPAALKNILRGAKKHFFDYIETCLDHDIEYLVKGKILSMTIGDKIRKIFEEYKYIIDIKQGVLIHHDLADHNIMFAGNKITAIFDWEACCVGDPVLDLASCPTWRTHYSREEKFLEGYKSISELPEFFKEKRDIYRLRTMLWKMVFAIRANIVTPERKHKFFSALLPYDIKKPA